MIPHAEALSEILGNFSILNTGGEHEELLEDVIDAAEKSKS